MMAHMLSELISSLEFSASLESRDALCRDFPYQNRLLNLSPDSRARINSLNMRASRLLNSRLLNCCLLNCAMKYAYAAIFSVFFGLHHFLILNILGYGLYEVLNKGVNNIGPYVE